MYSFYGGKQGRTYKLVQHYDSIQQMVELFQQGGSYNTVNYDEYVIIDTIVNDNHYGSPENGIIYCRGLDFNEPFNPNGIPLNGNGTVEKEDIDEQTGNKRYYDITYDEQENEIVTFNEERYKSNLSAFVQRPGGGARYVGQIVGPQGQAPELSILEWGDFLEEYESASSDLHKDTIIVNPPAGAEFDEETRDVIEESIKDTIDYGYLDIKDADGNITGAYISLNIPYSVFKYHAQSIEPYEPQEGETHFAQYDEEQKVWKYTNLITEDQISKNHNYFWQYDIKVPKGVRGQDLQEFGININPELETGDDVETQDWIDEETGEPILDKNGDPVTDINYRYYRIYRNYELSAEGEPTKEYIDSWQKTIHKITNNGSIPDYPLIQRDTDYSIGDRVAANGLQNNLFLIATTDGITSSDSLPALQTFERGRTFEDGTVTWQVFEDTVVSPSLLTVHYTHDGNENIQVRLLDDIFINQENGRIYAKYSDLESSVYLGENQSIIAVDYIDTPWVDPTGVQHTIDRLRIKFNTYNYDENGRIIVNSNYRLDGQGNIIWPTTDAAGHRVQFIDEQFKFLDRIETDPDTKDVIAYYNDGTSIYLGVLRAIQNVYIDNEGDLGSAKYFVVQYNNQLPDGTYQADYINQNPLNQVACIQQYGDNIILLYSDPQVRQSLYRAGVDYAIPNTTYTIPNYQIGSGNDDGNGNLYWINLGSIYHSNHVFGNFDSLAQLKQEYPYGLDKDTNGQIVSQNKDHAGWFATIIDSQTGSVSLYAYDYRGTEQDPADNWYQISDMSASSVNPEWIMLISKPDENNSSVPPQAKSALLNENGYWFVISERAD